MLVTNPKAIDYKAYDFLKHWSQLSRKEEHLKAEEMLTRL
jgi:hypothetical protein